MKKITITPYKLSKIKEKFEQLGIDAIPNIEDGDFKGLASIFVLGVCKDYQAFNELMVDVTDEQKGPDDKDWKDVEFDEVVSHLADFFTAIPVVSNALIHQLKAGREILQNLVTEMMKAKVSDLEETQT